MTNINMHRINNSIQQARKINNSTQNKTNKHKSSNFEDLISGIGKQDIKFSKHAQMRMDKRNLKLSSSDIEKLGNAIDKSHKKGVREALIIMNNQSFIANTTNKTIITAVANDSLEENIFTNIDGAVII